MVPNARPGTVPQTAPPAVPVIARTSPYRFYVRMAGVMIVIAIAGFIPTYWAPVARGSFSGAPILHAHGLLFTAWLLVFLLQARFAAAGRFERHRMLGFAGVSLATAMLFVGVGVSLHSMEQGIARGLEHDARSFAIVPLTIITGFVVLVGAAIANVRRSDIHMRLMLVASISMLPPAFARLIRLATGNVSAAIGNTPPVAFTLIPNLLADLLIVAAIVHDWRTRGRPHPVYLLAGGALLLVQVGRVPLADTAAWHAVTEWLPRFGA
jgi:hypothetical protein